MDNASICFNQYTKLSIIGRLDDIFGRVRIYTYGFALFTVGSALASIALFLFSTTNATTSYFILTAYMILLGLGTGLFVAPNLRAVMSSVLPERHGIGSALFTLFLNIGLTVSLNFAVLIMSFTAPYDLISQILTAVNTQSIPTAAKALFLASLKNTYLVFAIVNSPAIIPAAIGGRIKRTQTAMPAGAE